MGDVAGSQAPLTAPLSLSKKAHQIKHRRTTRDKIAMLQELDPKCNKSGISMKWLHPCLICTKQCAVLCCAVLCCAVLCCAGSLLDTAVLRSHNSTAKRGAVQHTAAQHG